MTVLTEALGLSSLPAGWNAQPLWTVAHERRGNLNSGMREHNLLSLSFGRVVRKDIDTTGGLLPESFEGYQVVEDGDLILRLTDLQNDKRSLRSGLCTERGIITSAYVALEPVAVEPRYFAYLMRAYDVAKVLYPLGGGLRQSLKFEDIRMLPIPLPPVEEQRRIADFLDDQVARIDSLLREKSVQRSSIQERFRELRDALLEGALSPGTSREPTSHIEWPTPALARVVGMKAGDFISAESIEEEGRYAVYGANGLRGFTDTFTHSGETLLVGRQGALCGNVHMVDGKFWASEHALVLTPRIRLEKRWLAQLLTSMNLGQYSVSAAQPGISVDRISGLRIPLPPLETQRTIAVRCMEAELSASSAVEVIDTSRRLLEERKRALITAAVTGEMDVTTARPLMTGSV